jgi:hypothetical protein
VSILMMDDVFGVKDFVVTCNNLVMLKIAKVKTFEPLISQLFHKL